jgi:4'-phosphopantetheinyl transferase
MRSPGPAVPLKSSASIPAGRTTVRRTLRQLLAGQLGIRPSDLALAQAAGGRPIIDPSHGSRLVFSVSYSDRLALIAIAEGDQIGVDIERQLHIAEANDIVHRYFSQRERRQWNRLALHERERAFYRAWTRKEAILKAMGHGLRYPLDAFTLTFGPAERPEVLELTGDHCADWRLYDVSPDDAYAAALAVRGGSLKLNLWRIVSSEESYATLR